MRASEHELGTLEAGKLPDILVVDDNVMKDVSILEDRETLLVEMQGGFIRAGKLAVLEK